MTYHIKPIAHERLKDLGLTEQHPYILDMECPPPPLEFLLKDADEFGLFSRGDVQGIAGKAKSGKSTAITIFLSAFIKGEAFGFHTPDRNPRRVLYIDTEQNPSLCHLRLVEMCKMIDLPTDKNIDNFRMLTLREFNWNERREIVCQQIKEYCPDVVFIDGVADLSNDINDSKSAPETMQILKKLTKRYECAICMVLHLNKNDDNLRGHIGTEMKDAINELFIVTRDQKTGLSKLEPNNNRTDKTMTLYYTVEGTDRDADKKIVIVKVHDGPGDNIEEFRSKLEKAFGNDISMSQDELRKRLKFKSRATIKEFVEKADRLKLISVTKIGRCKIISYHGPKQDFSGIDIDEADNDN